MKTASATSLIILFGCILVLSQLSCSREASTADKSKSSERIWKPDTTSEFEVGTQIRAWTMQDEGMDYILDNMQSMAGINNLYMVVVMHQEHRPFQAPAFPHNPKRDFWEAEDSRVTFFPDWKRYGKIKPQLSDHDFIREKDFLKMMVDAARARNLRVGAEVSHFPIPKQMIRDNPDWQMKTIDGEPWNNSRFCPNHPDVREYLVALFGDLAANYDLDYIQTCQYLFNDKKIDDGGTCFCNHCFEKADTMGIDLKAVKAALLEDKDDQKALEQWQQFRIRVTNEVYRELSEIIRKENPNCHLRLNDVYQWGGGKSGRYLIDFGMDLKLLAPYFGSFVNQDHQEQLGRENETFEHRKWWLGVNREGLGPDIPFISGIAPRMAASPELVKRGIKVALEHPANINGLALKHYDGASFSLLRAFKQGMIEAGVRGLPPALGKEVEEMTLDGYAPFTEELIEEWGVKTTTEGTASYSFDLPSGEYDIRITYFDGEDGHSQVSLFVAGNEQATFSMDEDVDCWRWRRFDEIQVNRGDEIKLVGKADKEEKAILDFIEFIPR